MPRIGVGGGKFGVHGGVTVGKGGIGYGGGVGPVGASGGFNPSREPGGCSKAIVAYLVVGLIAWSVFAFTAVAAACLMIAPALALVSYPFFLRGRRPPAAGLLSVVCIGAIVLPVGLLVVRAGHQASVRCNAQPGYPICVNQEMFAAITTILLIVAATATGIALIVSSAAIMRALAGRSPHTSAASSTPRARIRDEFAATRVAFRRRPRIQPPGATPIHNGIRFIAPVPHKVFALRVLSALYDAGFKNHSATATKIVVKGGFWRNNSKRAEVVMHPASGDRLSTQCEIVVTGLDSGMIEGFVTNKLLGQVASVVATVITTWLEPTLARTVDPLGRGVHGDATGSLADPETAASSAGRCPRCGAAVRVPTGQASSRCPDCRLICVPALLVD